MNSVPDLPHVLVIDDNLDATEVLALLIEVEGFSTATARTLAEGHAQLARQRPDLVILDLKLPDGSGLDLLAALKADPATASVQVVLLSGLINDQVREEAQRLGAAAFLSKPLEHEQLVAILDSVR